MFQPAFFKKVAIALNDLCNQLPAAVTRTAVLSRQRPQSFQKEFYSESQEKPKRSNFWTNTFCSNKKEVFYFMTLFCTCGLCYPRKSKLNDPVAVRAQWSWREVVVSPGFMCRGNMHLASPADANSTELPLYTISFMTWSFYPFLFIIMVVFKSFGYSQNVIFAQSRAKAFTWGCCYWVAF